MKTEKQTQQQQQNPHIYPAQIPSVGQLGFGNHRRAEYTLETSIPPPSDNMAFHTYPSVMRSHVKKKQKKQTKNKQPTNQQNPTLFCGLPSFHLSLTPITMGPVRGQR